ncbi:MAG: uroporphyrinogen decarboxylase [Spirochaetaceae bacterium]|nr:MAG: uroporphyrinogen decarboxylase [Spirochaetaceae bacterium]
MNRRETVLAAINKQETQVIPYQLDLTDLARARLQEHFGDPDFEKGIGNHLAQERNEILHQISPSSKRDMFGVLWETEQEGDFGVVTDYILKEADFGDYRFPEPDEDVIRAKCEALRAVKDEQFTMYIIGFSLFERAWSLRGMENVLMDFITDPAFVNELFERINEYNLKVIDIVAEYPIDCIFFGDDWGQQKGLIMGPEHWRRLIKPHLRRLYERVQDHGMYIAQHSCGDIQELFPDLIEMGADIYNTFQPEVYDIGRIKDEYGQHLTFYGGISTQRLLPMSDPDTVRRETRRLMGVLGRRGGYIVAPTHAIPNDVPTENILALLQVMQEQ